MKNIILTLMMVLVIKFAGAQCQANFNFTVTGLNATFSNTSTPAHTRSFWDFGDGTFSNDNNLTVNKNYAQAGYYMVKLTMYNNLCYHDTTKLVLVGSPGGLCHADFTFVGAGNNVTFTSTSLGNPTVYLWEFGDGSVSTLQNPVHAYTNSGYYNVRLRIFTTTPPICMDSYNEVISVGSSTDCRSDFDFLVDNDSVFFNDKSIGNNLAHYNWNFGDGTYSSQQNPKKKFNQPGFYNVCLSVWDNSNTCYNTGCRYVPVTTTSNTCNASFNYYASAGRIVNFRDNSTGNPISFNWDFGDGSNATSANVTHIYSAAGLYLVHLRASNASSSSDYIQLINVEMGNNIGLQGMFAYLINNNYHYKAATPIDFKGSSLGDPSRVVWNYGDGNKDSSSVTPYHVYADTGSYNVCVTMVNSNTNQSDTYCKTIHVLAEGVNEYVENKISLSASPNPFSTSTNITYFIPKSGIVSLTIYDLIGNKKEVLVNKDQQQGIYTYIWNRKALENGLYLLEFKTSYGTIVKKITIIE